VKIRIRTCAMLCLALLLAAALLSCTPGGTGTTTPVTDPSSPTTPTQPTQPTGSVTEKQQEIMDLLLTFSPTESVSTVKVKLGSQSELTQTETMTVTESDGGRIFRLKKTSQRLLPIIIDENHQVISAGGISEETTTQYLREGEEGAFFPAVGMALSAEDYDSLSVKENSDGTCTLTCTLSAKKPPAWLEDACTGSLTSGYLTVTADLAAGQITAITVFLNAWTDYGTSQTRITVTYDYTPKSFSLPG